jgi:ubiquinone/menaquinone biosynthesis C-methylase UbiE
MAEYSEKDDFAHHDKEVDDLLQAVQSHGLSIPDDGLILDTGGGLGMHAWKLLPLCRKLYVTDIIDYSSSYNGELLKLLEEKHARNGRPFDLRKVVLAESDAQNQLFRDSLFDFVFSINAFEHIPDPAKAFGEVVRVAKPGALVYVTIDPLWLSPTGGHFHEYVEEPWAHLVWPSEQYLEKMHSAGASAGEIAGFPNGMNRYRLGAFRELFSNAEKQQFIQILMMNTWPASAAEEPHTEHPNFARLLSMGYPGEELFVRGLRIMARVTKTSRGASMSPGSPRP